MDRWGMKEDFGNDYKNDPIRHKHFILCKRNVAGPNDDKQD